MAPNTEIRSALPPPHHVLAKRIHFLRYSVAALGGSGNPIVMATCFPRNRDLEPHLHAEGWRWRTSPHNPKHWIGVDQLDREWLVKISDPYADGFDVLRERAFDFIAQEIGLSCQSCVFLTLPEDSEPMLRCSDTKPHQGAITYIQHHDPQPCGSNCDPGQWRAHLPPPTLRRLLEMEQRGVRHATDLIVGNVLGNLCGASERREFVVSRDHRLFLVDNEFTLLMKPEVQDALDYIGTVCIDENDWRHVAEILVPKLERMGSISDSTLKSFTEIPKGYTLLDDYPIPTNLLSFRATAGELVAKLRSRT